MATASGSSTQTEGKKKQKHIEELVRTYFVQLTEGCGNSECNNVNCATGCKSPMERSKAAATAMSFVSNKSKKIHVCLPKDKVTHVSSNRGLPPLNLNSIPPTSSGSSNTTLPSSSTNSDLTEPMETTDSSESAMADGSRSNCDSAASSGLVRMNSSVSSVQMEAATPQQRLAIPSIVGVSSSSDEVESIGEQYTHPTGVMVSPVLTSALSSGDVMDISPSVQSMYHSNPLSPKNTSVGALCDGCRIISYVIRECPCLNEETVLKLIQQGQSAGDPDFRELTNQLWVVYSSPEYLNKSFVLPKEQQNTVTKQTGISVDLKATRKAYSQMFDLDCDRVQNTLINAMDMYKVCLQSAKSFKNEKSLSHIVILMENPMLSSPEFLKSYTKLLQIVESLPMAQKERLIQWYSHYGADDLLQLVRSLQQLITIQLLFGEEGEYARFYLPQTDPAIATATSVLGLLYFANLVKAKREGSMKEFCNSLNSFMAKIKPEFLQSSDPEYEQLILRLQVHPCLVRTFPIPTSEFINEELNEKVDMAKDYQREYTGSAGEKSFAFLAHPFMLSVTNKVEKLYRDNIVSMYSERHRAVIHSVLTGVADVPFLVLRINRDTIIEDTLVQLEAIAELNPIDLRKQLRIEFNGEDGVDEGGLQKEFFQLLVEKLFDPVYGLFMFDESTQQHWINPNSLEGESEYKLIGLLLGLAIYNNIILDIRFPVVIYRKLLGCPVDFSDLSSSHPEIAKGLQSLLDIPEDDSQKIEEMMLTFEVSHADMFGNQAYHELKENGKSIPVTSENRQEFVDMYTEWLLVSSILHKFAAFKQGFDLVMSQSCLADLVIAEELELIICGSTEWDIDALEESTRYDGFSPRHPVIVNFWEIVREFSESQRKKLLAFITGSDRIPLGGLSKLKLIIVKNGPDSDRLPTAHTCFNALLLCEYSTKDKLKDRLVKAISNSKGFGMI